MKNSKVCPKCQQQRIIRIPGQAGAYGSGNNIPVGLTVFSSIKVTRFVCIHCGFSEEWIESPDDLYALEQKYGKE